MLRASIFALFVAAACAAGTAHAQWPGHGGGGGGGGGPQQAQRRAVVVGFSGPQGARSRAAVVANLQENGWTIVSDSEVQSSGVAHPHGAQDYAAVAAATHAAVVVGGGSAHNRRTWSVTVTVYNGRDGSRLGSSTWSGGTMSALTGPRGNASDRLGRYLSQGQPGQPPPPEQHENAWDAARHDTGMESGSGEGNGNEEEMAGEGDEEEQAPLPDENTWDGFVVYGEGGTIHRQMDALVFPAHLAMGPGPAGSELRSYESAVPGSLELGLGGEIYPGALIHGQPFPYLGLVVNYRHSVGLSSNGCPPTGGDCNVPLPTEQQEFYLGLRGRIAPLGHVRNSLQLELDVGFDLFSYTFDTAALLTLDKSNVIPPISYQDLHFGIGASYQLVPTYLRLGIRAIWRVGLTVGDDAKRIWGLATGAGDAAMVQIFVRHEMAYLVRGLFVGIDIDWFAYYTKFNGDTACALAAGCRPPPLGDNDPWERVHIPHGVTDSYVRVSINFGYAFR